MRVPKISAKAPKEFLIKLDRFRGGSNTLLNPARLRKDFAVEINNLWQVQDGIWKTRPGRAYYGQEITGVSLIDGAWEYEKSDGTREIIAIAGGYAWKSQDGGSWTQLTGTTFTIGARPYFIQIGSKLFIANGTDPLAYYDGTNLNTYSGLSNPSAAPTTTRTGLTAGSYSNYYRIQATNEIGETLPSPSVNVTTNKPRSQWDTSNYITLSWSAITGAKGYQVFWGEFDGEETLIAETTSTTFNDYGETTYPHNPYIETNDDNTTQAPLFKSMEISGNRLWATGNDNAKWRVYFSGTGQYFVSPAFSPFYGGGWIDLEKGGKNKPVAVAHYRTGKGDPIITVFCSSADGNGTIFQIELTTITIGSVTATVPAAYKIVGSVGADAPSSVVKVYDNVFFANKKGIYALRNKQQMFNVLANDDLTAPIRNMFESINQDKISDIVAYFKPPRVYFSFTVGSENDTTAIFDMERGNWTWKWTFGAKQFFEYTDNNGRTHFLVVPSSGNKLVELSENYEDDFGSPFYQSYISPLIPIDKDMTVMAKIKEVVYELGKFKGSAIIEILGVTKNKQVVSLATKTVETQIGTSGWGSDLFSDFLFSTTNSTPQTYIYDTIKKKLKVNKKLYAIQFKIYTTNKATFEILGMQAKGYLLPKRAPSTWN
ncbi:MAG: hypothetical protein D6831_03850 [Aquificota bacterium]|nr:MAG: hypothetical protein D6831_03850 [Aquificota bacterium]